MPKRIQRQRTKGWRMPEGTVYVGRPGLWGNPFWHVARFHGVDRSLALFRDTVQGIWDPSNVKDWPDHYVSQVYDEHRRWVKRIKGHPLELLICELRGKDLACWCALDQPCHGDILLELANRTSVIH